MNKQQGREAKYKAAIEDLMWERRRVQVGSIWHHTRSGKRYCVEGLVLREHDLAVLVTYRAIGEMQVVWARPIKEFMDGRFTAIEDTWRAQK